ncbi:MAG TPA: DUF3106 domain-containing protein [Verrucomicrobiae bacterium]|jgi:hypothetical protein
MKTALLHLCLLGLALCHAGAQPPQIPAAGLPFPPVPQSPIALFRMLLATNAEGRTQWITKWKPAQRQYLESKVAEFTKLAVEEREMRLQTLELRWYLPQLMTMTMTPAERIARLASIPQPQRSMLEAKLVTWDIQLPATKKDLLDHLQAVSVVMFPSPGSSENAWRGLPAERQEELRRQFENYNALPEERREQVLAHFKLYFEFTPAEKSKALQKLTSAQQAQMKKTLAPFEILPPPLREKALTGVQKFAELSPAERAAFLQSADRWKKMSEAEREKWRLRAAQVQKTRALIPPPPLPPTANRTLPTPTLVATN